MTERFRLEIVTPEATVFSEEVESIVVPAWKGYYGVLSGHAPFLGILSSGEIHVGHGQKASFFATSGGYIEVTPKKTLLLTESAERVDAIDLSRAEKAKERALKRLTEKPEGTDVARAHLALERAENRLKIAEKHRHS